MPLAKDFNHTFAIDGHILACGISPCSWMYNDYGLQLEVILSCGGGKACLHRKDISFTDATEDDVMAMLRQIKLVPCPRCGKPAFDPSTVRTNREGLCETCFISDINAEFEKEQAKQRAVDHAENRKALADGKRWRVDAAVHSGAGDDMFVYGFYAEKPSDERVKQELLALGSVKTCVDDYAITDLAAMYDDAGKTA
jgi:hypothetical protein